MADRYWVSASAAGWDNTAGTKWATSSGGSGGASVPTSADNVFLDANSPSNVNLTNVGGVCANLDATGFTHAIDNTGSGSGGITIHGNCTLGSGMSFSGSSEINGALRFSAAATQVLTSNGVTVALGVLINNVSCVLQLADNANFVNSDITRDGLRIQNGTLDLNGKTLVTNDVFSSTSTVRGIKSSANGGVLRLTSTGSGGGGGINIGMNISSATDFTIDRSTGTWTIEIAGSTTNAQSFNGAGLTWPALSITNATASGTTIFGGAVSNTFKSLTVTGAKPHTIQFGNGTTTTIEDNDGFASGVSGSLVSIRSVTLGTTHTLAKSGGGTILSSYLSVRDSIASPGSTWIARNSTDGGNNTSWVFDTALTPTVGSLTTAGNPPGISIVTPLQYRVNEAGTSLRITEAGDYRVTEGSIVPVEGSLTLSGNAPTIDQTTHATVTPVAGTITAAGVNPTVEVGATVTPTVGAVTISGVAPTVLRGSVVDPTTGAIVTSGLAPSIFRQTWITPNVGSLTTSGVAPSILRGTVAQPISGPLNLSGYAPAKGKKAGLLLFFGP